MSVPALIAKVGYYPWHHGGVGAIRSLGRLGVPVYAITEDRWTPAVFSRYLAGHFVWPTNGLESPEWLVAGLLDVGRRIGRPTVLLAFDDEAAVLIAEHATELRECFLLPETPVTLPRQLASKQGLYRLCQLHGIPTPAAEFPVNREELEPFAAVDRFPVMAKNVEVFTRKRAPVVGGSTRIETPEQLRAMASHWGETFSVLLQEYLPVRDSEDWIVHAYNDESANPLVQFTGVKIRSSPPQAGMTSCAQSVTNPVLSELSARIAKSVGYSGPLDLDWRRDRRTGSYYLLDFNPRIGAQFRLFENEAGIDIVRAIHLHLTGRPVPPAEQVDGRRYIVENVDLRAALAPSDGYRVDSVTAKPRFTEFAWWAPDDIRPLVVTVGRRLLGKL